MKTTIIYNPKALPNKSRPLPEALNNLYSLADDKLPMGYSKSTLQSLYRELQKALSSEQFLSKGSENTLEFLCSEREEIVINFLCNIYEVISQRRSFKNPDPIETFFLTIKSLPETYNHVLIPLLDQMSKRDHNRLSKTVLKQAEEYNDNKFIDLLVKDILNNEDNYLSDELRSKLKKQVDNHLNGKANALGFSKRSQLFEKVLTNPQAQFLLNDFIFPQSFLNQKYGLTSITNREAVLTVLLKNKTSNISVILENTDFLKEYLWSSNISNESRNNTLEKISENLSMSDKLMNPSFYVQNKNLELLDRKKLLEIAIQKGSLHLLNSLIFTEAFLNEQHPDGTGKNRERVLELLLEDNNKNLDILLADRRFLSQYLWSNFCSEEFRYSIIKKIFSNQTISHLLMKKSFYGENDAQAIENFNSLGMEGDFNPAFKKTNLKRQIQRKQRETINALQIEFNRMQKETDSLNNEIKALILNNKDESMKIADEIKKCPPSQQMARLNEQLHKLRIHNDILYDSFEKNLRELPPKFYVAFVRAINPDMSKKTNEELIENYRLKAIEINHCLREQYEDPIRDAIRQCLIAKMGQNFTGALVDECTQASLTNLVERGYRTPFLDQKNKYCDSYAIPGECEPYKLSELLTSLVNSSHFVTPYRTLTFIGDMIQHELCPNAVKEADIKQIAEDAVDAVTNKHLLSLNTDLYRPAKDKKDNEDVISDITHSFNNPN
ncbi:MAG: hypothetical protein H2069_09470 [Legionella sp.]|nr:hypothetical protein [Legionella sp.]